jgi:hypothetical protein
MPVSGSRDLANDIWNKNNRHCSQMLRHV